MSLPRLELQPLGAVRAVLLQSSAGGGRWGGPAGAEALTGHLGHCGRPGSCRRTRPEP